MSKESLEVKKERVSIAVQILNNPSVILLDEPTTCLDSFTSSFIIQMLSSMAKTGKNVIATIHQPPSHALELVDNVLLIGKGGVVVYFGSPNNMLKFFSSQGLNCPPKMSLADFVIDQTSLDGRSKERQAETTTRLQELVSAFKNYKKETPSRKLENIEMAVVIFGNIIFNVGIIKVNK